MDGSPFERRPEASRRSTPGCSAPSRRPDRDGGHRRVRCRRCSTTASGSPPQRPASSSSMPRFRNDGSVEPARSGGDVSIVVQADTHDAAMHALRQVLRRTRGDLAVRWMREGYNTLDHAAPPAHGTGAQPDGLQGRHGQPRSSSDGAPMDRHVWISRGDGQPAWAVGGTFQADPRHPHDGRVLGPHPPERAGGAVRPPPRQRRAARPGDGRRDVPALRRGDFESHIARANPRTPGSERSVILRRPFSYVGGTDDNYAARPGAPVHVLPAQPRRRVPHGAATARRRGAGGVHPPARRRLLRRAPRPGRQLPRRRPAGILTVGNG